jgi:hypothetical protein
MEMPCTQIVQQVLKKRVPYEVPNDLVMKEKGTSSMLIHPINFEVASNIRYHL